jgi:hypothetical protein
LIYDVDGWAYHNNARGLEAYAPSDFEVSSSPARVGGHHLSWDVILGDQAVDLVFSFYVRSMPAAREALTRRGWPSRLIGAWSVGWTHLWPLFYRAHCVADAMLVSSLECWNRGGRLPGTYTIPYGVDGAIFHLRAPIATRRPKVLWVGSHLARTVKGYDEFVLPLQAALRARGIDCECLLVDSLGAEKRSPDAMAEWYNSGTVIVCASEAEGTPNPPLEAAACGCTIVSTAVGNMPELIRNDVNGYLVPREAEALLEGVLAAIANHERLATQMQQDIVRWLWTHRSPEFYAMFRDVLGSREVVPDLSHKVTAFVATGGGRTLPDCLDHLGRQDVKFKLEIVENAPPLSAAFQRALVACETPYVVQIEEDMLLSPHAIRTLVDELEQQAPEVAMYVAPLYDGHLDRATQGVKISRRAMADGDRIAAAPTERLTRSSSSVLGRRATR